MRYLIITIISALALLWGCAAEPTEHINSPTPVNRLPNTYGRPNQIFVIADSSLWNGAVGDSFFYYFAAPYILLPQPEPIFDIQHMDTGGVTAQPKSILSALFSWLIWTMKTPLLPSRFAKMSGLRKLKKPESTKASPPSLHKTNGRSINSFSTLLDLGKKNLLKTSSKISPSSSPDQ
ncbi:MAG: DUF4837 family protein [Saprospiraceae bacterium]